jgi:hypothetical protein
VKKTWIVALSVIAGIAIISLTVFVFRGSIFNKVMEVSILKAGRPLKFGSYNVFIKKIENNKLYGITVTEKNRKMTAESGEYEYLPQDNAVRLSLNNGVADEAEVKNPNALRRLTFKKLILKIRLK